MTAPSNTHDCNVIRKTLGKDQGTYFKEDCPFLQAADATAGIPGRRKSCSTIAHFRDSVSARCRVKGLLVCKLLRNPQRIRVTRYKRKVCILTLCLSPSVEAIAKELWSRTQRCYGDDGRMWGS